MNVTAAHVRQLLAANRFRSRGELIVYTTGPRRDRVDIISPQNHDGSWQIALLYSETLAERVGDTVTDEQAEEIAAELNTALACGDGVCHCETCESRRAWIARRRAAKA